MKVEIRYHIVGFLSGLLLIVIVYGFFYSKVSPIKSTDEVMDPGSFLTVPVNDPVGVARFSFTKALSHDIGVRWVYPASDLCMTVSNSPEIFTDIALANGMGAKGDYELVHDIFSGGNSKSEDIALNRNNWAVEVLSANCVHQRNTFSADYVLTKSIRTWRALESSGIVPSKFAVSKY